MSYGFRLNVEDIFLKNAEESWNKSILLMSDIEDENIDSMERFYFKGPKDKESISHCVFALTGWAICLESFINLAWNTNEYTQDDEENLKKYNTLQKIKHLLKINDYELSRYNWISDIKRLFKERNDLLHYKDIIEYQAFTFATKYQKILSYENLKSFREAVFKCIEIIAQIDGLDTKLLNTEYELFTYDE